jgi:hypothetical protein
MFYPMVSQNLPTWAEAVTALTSLLTLLVVGLAAVQIRHVNRQMHRELEMQYLLRFWQLMDRRSRTFRLKMRTTRDDRVLLQEYLGLCEDQVQLRSFGRVTDHTWVYWKQDIRAMCVSPPVAKELSKSNIEDYPHLRSLLALSTYDPLTHSRLWRLWNGL